MVENHKQAADAFWEAWTPEFIKSVEMFAGQTVTIEPGADADTAQTLGSEDSILWQGQVFEREGTGTVWIGTPTAACRALTAGSAEDDAGGEALYRELLRQSFEGAAHILSSGLTPRIVCKRAIEDRGRPLDLALVRSAWMKGPDQGRASARTRIGFRRTPGGPTASCARCAAQNHTAHGPAGGPGTARCGGTRKGETPDPGRAQTHGRIARGIGPACRGFRRYCRTQLRRRSG